MCLDREKLLNRVRAAAKKLKEKLDFVEEVYLFGSLAKGTAHGLSDVDLIVVSSVPLRKENFKQIYGEVHDVLSETLNFDFDLVVCDRHSFAENRDRYGELKRLDY